MGKMNAFEDIDSSPSLKEGMLFDSATAAVHAVQDHALFHGKSVRVDKRSGVHRQVVCTGSGCGAFARIYRKQVDNKPGPWYIVVVTGAHQLPRHSKPKSPTNRKHLDVCVRYQREQQCISQCAR